MNIKKIHILIKYFHPIIIIFFLVLFRYISFFNFIIGYFTYCLYIYYSSNTYLYYTKNEFNNNILNNCPSIKNPKFRQYFYLPFNLFQFFLQRYTIQRKFNQEINLEEEKVDDEGTTIIWASCKNIKNDHSKPALLVFPGITGKCSDSYIKNIISAGLKNHFDVVIYQMRILSHQMKMPKNTEYVYLNEDINNSIKKIKEVNKNDLYAIGFSYGANLLTNYLGTKNVETNHICAAISISNPFDCIMSERLGEDTIFEDLILYFEKKNYIPVAYSINKEKDFIDINYLKACKRIRDFDAKFAAKILGYKNADDYYRGISSINNIKSVNIPFLIIHSKDDPVCSYKGLPVDAIFENKNIIFILTDKGAHSCFIENKKNFSISVTQWSLKPVIEFLNYFKNKNSKNNIN